MNKLLSNRWLLLIVLVFVASLIGVVVSHRSIDPATATLHTLANGKTASPATPGFNDKLFSLTDPASPWVIVNKQRPLAPKTYAPDVVVPNMPLRSSGSSGEMHVGKQMAPALEKMYEASKAAGVPLMLASGYRSYDLQVAVYGAEVKNYGQATADRESARPGYSEHQTGLAADLEPVGRNCEVAQCFGATPEGKWLAANAADYGFIIRYGEGQEPITGYLHEPWHVRYVGVELAKEVKQKGNIPLETFFKLGAAANY